MTCNYQIIQKNENVSEEFKTEAPSYTADFLYGVQVVTVEISCINETLWYMNTFHLHQCIDYKIHDY